MPIQHTFIGDTKTLEALRRFLDVLAEVSPEPVCPPKVIRGEDNVIYVEVGYGTDEETLLVSKCMADVGADILEETGLLVALAPFVVATAKHA